MNPGAVWWGQIGHSLRLLDRVTGALRECRSAMLQISGRLPWREAFYEAVDFRRTAFGSQRRLVRLAWAEGADPGEFVLERLCSETVRADYWPGESYAAYLGGLEGIPLWDCYVWVTGVHRRSDLAGWAGFAEDYARRAGAGRGAVFVLEYDGPPQAVSGLEVIPCPVESYDLRVFALEAAAALGNAGVRSYQAELALRLSGADPELCAALLSRGEALLHAPAPTALTVSRSGRDSAGAPFRPLDELEANSAAWEAAVVLLFPILERFRMGLIRANEAELARHLPISNSNGEVVRDPYDLEIGPLCYIVTGVSRSFSQEEVEAVRLCRRVRNLLAHNKAVPLEEVEQVFRLGAGGQG